MSRHLPRHAAREARVGPVSGGRGEERLRLPAGGVASEPDQDQRPGLGDVGEVDLGVSLAEAVVPEKHTGSGWCAGRLAQLPFPGRALPERETGRDPHADKLVWLGSHLRQQVYRGLRKAKPRAAAGHLTIGGPKTLLAPGRRQDLKDAGAVGVDISSQDDRSVHEALQFDPGLAGHYFSSI